MGTEDDLPTTPHRSAFDTEPCQRDPTFGEAAALAEMVKLIAPDMSPHDRLQLCADSIREVRRVAVDFTGKDEAGNPVRVSANGRAAFPVALEFPSPPTPGAERATYQQAKAVFAGLSSCGPVTIPEPTRAALLLSAKQWATAVREELENDLLGGSYSDDKRLDKYSSKLDRLDAVLAELAAMEAK